MITHKHNGVATHLVLVDIGNTNVTLATSANGQRGDSLRLAAEPVEVVADGLVHKWESLPESAQRAVVVSSVAPQRLEHLECAARERGISPLLVIGRELPLPIGADLPHPEKVGTDRLCAAAAAFARCNAACVVADFGTALTIDLVADNGVFMGGTILPGMRLSALALHEHTALLPLVDVGVTSETLGKDTVSAIRNGIFAMMVGALREVTERYATQIGKWPMLIVTGGHAQDIASACDFVDRVAPDLCLDGVLLAYEQHRLEQPGQDRD